MHRNRESIIEACRVLAEQENLQVTLKEAGKGALFAGMGVFIGGLLAGPLGMAVGGSLTSIAVAVSAQGKFKPVAVIISEMNEDQRRRLSEAVTRAVQNVRPEDCIGLLTLALSSASTKEMIITEIGAFLLREFNMQMIQNA